MLSSKFIVNSLLSLSYVVFGIELNNGFEIYPSSYYFNFNASLYFSKAIALDLGVKTSVAQVVISSSISLKPQKLIKLSIDLTSSICKPN